MLLDRLQADLYVETQVSQEIDYSPLSKITLVEYKASYQDIP